MSLVHRFAASAAALAGLAACQSYSYAHMGKCLVAPASQRATLAGPTTADIVFVVDDSASMASKQAALAANFDQFITSLNQYNIDRVARGLDPFDFHIAVTTSSVYDASPRWGTACALGAGGKTQCCDAPPTSCAPVASCQPGASCGAGGTCAIARSPISPGTYPPVEFAYRCCTVTPGSCRDEACFPGDACADHQTTFGCSAGVSTAGTPFPAGGFVAAPGSPKILHFTKDLYAPTLDAASVASLTNQFKQNIQVGTCGSPQEQHLEAARLALQQVISGAHGSELPHLGAKLVVVWVGDEDDCSSPSDPARSIVLSNPGDTGADECVADKNVARQNGGVPAQDRIPARATPVADYDAFFAGLVAPAGQAPTPQRPYSSFSAVFITGAVPCVGDPSKPDLVVAYTPADQYLAPVCPAQSTPLYTVSATSSRCPADGVGIWAEGTRFKQLADLFQAQGLPVVEDTVCDSIPPRSFGNVLSRVADLVKPLTSVTLPTRPAAGDVTLLRVLDRDGNSRRVCPQETAPGPVADPTRAGGWWFMDCGAPLTPPPPVATDGAGHPVTTACIYVNPASHACDASPGDSYSAEYLGVVPPGGCPHPSDAAAATHSSAGCAQALGGGPGEWWCYGRSTAATGTCICNSSGS